MTRLAHPVPEGCRRRTPVGVFLFPQVLVPVASWEVEWGASVGVVTGA